MAPGLEGHCLAAASHAWVYDSEVDGALGKITDGRLKKKGTGQNGLGGNLVGQIHQLGLGANTQDDPLHRTDVWVTDSEIC
jgi:hypothetical protein